MCVVSHDQCKIIYKVWGKRFHFKVLSSGCVCICVAHGDPRLMSDVLLNRFFTSYFEVGSLTTTAGAYYHMGEVTPRHPQAVPADMDHP